MNKKKWLGTIMTGSLIAGTTQNFAFCEDLFDILNTDKVNSFVLTKDCFHFDMAEYARHRLRKARDEAVAYGIAEKMQLIFEHLDNEDAKEELKGILENFSKEKTGELFYHLLIDKLLNITVDEMTEYEIVYFDGIPDGEKAVKVKVPFKEKTKLLEKLLDFGATENEVLAIYKEYDQKMKEIENEVKRIINKEVITIEDLKAVEEQIKLAENVVKAYYTEPAGYIRYLASRGIFLNKKSFPGMSDTDYTDNILVGFYGSKLPSLVLNKTYDAAMAGVDYVFPPFMFVHFFVDPLVKKCTKKVDDLALYKALNQDPHMSSMFKHSSLVKYSEFLDYIDFNLETYLADRVEKAVTAGCAMIRARV